MAGRTALIPLVLANAVTVSTLYWAQAVVSSAGAEFGPSTGVSLMPGATLAGYAAGVAVLAAAAGDLTAPRGLGRHVLLLAASLCAAAAASTAVFAALACVCIGLGCALTQRLLACASSAVAAERRPQTIAAIIAGGLCGIVLARACVPAASELLGWRAMFWTDAVLCGTSGLLATWASSRLDCCSAKVRAAPLPAAAFLWRREATLRRAAVQQALVFAAFNLGWAVFPHVLASHGAAPSVPMAVVASLGACAAIVSGRVCALRNPAGVARAGLGAVGLACAAFLLARQFPASSLVTMALLDVGTQISLVANQAQAQALASTPAIRGRLAAIVTTIGFAGGAAGAAAGNLFA